MQPKLAEGLPFLCFWSSLGTMIFHVQSWRQGLRASCGSANADCVNAAVL